MSVVLTQNTEPLFVLRLDITPASMVLLSSRAFSRKLQQSLQLDKISSGTQLFLKALSVFSYVPNSKQVCFAPCMHEHPLALRLSRELNFGAFNFCWCTLVTKIKLNKN